MSDPAKSAAKIEDVLASIRRLVSENQGTPVQTAPATDEPARLVLTSAHRVSDPDDPWAPVPAAEPAATAEAEAEAENPAWGFEDRLSDWGEIEDSAEEAVADALAEQAVETPPGPIAATEPDSRDRDTDPAQDEAPAFSEFEPETGDADWPEQGAPAALRQLALVRGHAGPETGAPVLDDRTEPAPYDWLDPVPDVAADRASAMTDAAPRTEDQPINTAPASDADATPSGAPRLFSRRVEVRRPATEPAAPQDPAAEAPWAKDAEANKDDDVEDLGEDGPTFTFPESDDGLLDEAALREIIAEVVREELQGTLGQKITRNVRKMVRREIRLALAAQDLD